MKRTLGLIGRGFALALICACGGRDDQVSEVRRGSFQSLLRETGELRAVRYSVVTMPRYRYSYGKPKITQLEKEGLQVSRGDVIGQIETAGVVRERGQKEADLAIALADLNTLVVQHETKLGAIQARMQSARSALKLARIDAERVKFESEGQQRLKKLGMEKAALSLRKTELEMEATHIVQAEELKIQEAKITRIRNAIAQAERTVENFTLRAPGEGIVEYLTNRSTRAKVAVGDQPWWGTALIGLPDLSRMMVNTNVNETDIDKVAVGQRAIVQLDAYPKFVFEGSVTTVSRISRKKDKDSKSKVFDVEVLLDGSDSILKPGMTVSCDMVVADLTDVLFVDNACIRNEAAGHAVYVKGLMGKKRLQVRIGPRNDRETVVYGDLKEGDRLVVSGAGGEV